VSPQWTTSREFLDTAMTSNALTSKLQEIISMIVYALFNLSLTFRVSSGQWIRWMKNVPAPLMVDLSVSFHHQISGILKSNYYKDEHNNILQQKLILESSLEEFLSRIACHVILLPSGCELQTPFQTPTGGISYGKLLYGGVKRSRLVNNGSSGINRKQPQRVAGERTAIMKFPDDNIPCWSQYGGPRRRFEAVDMGPAAFLEIILLPAGLNVNEIDRDENVESGGGIMMMTTTQLGFEPSSIFQLARTNITSEIARAKQHTEQYDDRNPDIDISDVVGGLREQIEAVTRRVLVSEEELIDLQELGLTLRPRGILLYGKPGVGKTIFAKQIAKKLNVQSINAIAAPELLDKWVGGSEKLVRELFKDAEADDDSAASSLHVIIIDEIDAVFRKRSVSEDSGEITRNSLVNQLLAKIDGVRELPNVLVIGMTNRKELIDEALLRPGRLEVQLHIPMPDAKGRREILKIHFDALLKNGRLSQPLCLSINGDSDPLAQPSSLKKYPSLLQKMKSFLMPSSSRYTIIRDLAEDPVTGGFSGADIAGLVRCAGSIALARSRRDGSGVDGVIITLSDVYSALDELKKQMKTSKRESIGFKTTTIKAT